MAQAEIIFPLGEYLRNLIDPEVAQMRCLGAPIPAGVMVCDIAWDDEQPAAFTFENDRTQPVEFVVAIVFEIGRAAFPGA